MYPHAIRIYRDTGGETDPNTGDYVPTLSQLYAGPADVQDEGAFFSMRTQVPERIAGQGDGTVWVPEQVDLQAVRPGDIVAVRWDGQVPEDADDDWWADQDGATVVRVVLLGSKIIVKGLE